MLPLELSSPGTCRIVVGRMWLPSSLKILGPIGAQGPNTLKNSCWTMTLVLTMGAPQLQIDRFTFGSLHYVEP